MERFLIAALGAVAVMLALILASHYRERPPAAAGQKGARSATFALAWLLLAALAAYAGFSTLEWRAVRAQLQEAVQAQLKEKARQHRAWVYATPSLNGPMIIKGHGVSLAARYKVENTGDAPAVDTEIVSAVIPHLELDILAVQKSLCEPLRAGKDGAPPPRDSLFPGQSINITRIEGVGADLVDGQNSRQGEGGLKFWWVGCVGYKSFGDPTRHRTGFIYEIAETGAGPRGIVAISLADQIIAKGRLVIIPYPHGGFAAD